MGCMEERGASEVCSKCGWREGTKPDSPLHLPPRTILGEKYVVGRVLGYGGFGITYLGWDMTFTRKLAIKEYMPNGVASRASGELNVTIFRSQADSDFEYGMQQFLEEGRTVARFQEHPGVVKVIDFVRANATAYLVMEHLDGCTLETFLSRNNGKLPFQAVLNIMTPVMDALRAVHKESFLHRDISPDNVFVLNNGGVKLIDFGAARFALSQRSKNLSVILKEGYAPPEQYSSKGNQGPWTDVYATAATIYRALTGKIPFPSLDRREGDELQPASQAGAVLAPEAELALHRGLAIRVQDRFPSMESFQAAISGLPEDHFAEGPEQKLQELIVGVSRPQSQRPLSQDPSTTRPVDHNVTRAFDPNAAHAAGNASPQVSSNPALESKQRQPVRKALLAAGGAVVILLLVWILKPKDAGGEAAPAGCVFAVNLPVANVPAAGQQVKVPVATASGCPWTATTDARWITLHTTTGSGNGEVTYTALSNTGQYARTAVINIAGQPHTVTQQAPPAESACNVSISPPELTAAATGGSGSIAVAANCPWSASSDSPWVSITGGRSANASGSVAYSIAGNPSAAPRTAVIVVAGQAHRISQAGQSSGSTPTACTFQLNPPSVSLSAGAGSGRTAVTTDSGCQWTASANVPWISIVSSPFGRGSGSVAYTVAPNLDQDARSGAILIGGISLMVNQAPGAAGPFETHLYLILHAYV
jgi:serine/threonine protein kinase